MKGKLYVFRDPGLMRVSDGKAFCDSGSRADDGNCFDGSEEERGNEVVVGICMSLIDFSRSWTCGNFFGLER